MRLLRVSKRGVLRDTTLVDASLQDEFLHERHDTDLDLSLAQTTFHVRHFFVSTGHAQTSFISSRSWRLTRVFLHALLRCAEHFNSTRLRLTSNALSTRTTERHITVGWCKEVSRNVLFSTHLITAISTTSTKTASPSFRAVS